MEGDGDESETTQEFHIKDISKKPVPVMEVLSEIKEN